MAENKVKQVKAELKDGVIEVKFMILHPELTYNQALKKGLTKDDANFILRITGNIGDKKVLDMSTSQFFSKNPVFRCKIKGDEFKKGDVLEIIAVDRKGDVLKKSTEIK